MGIFNLFRKNKSEQSEFQEEPTLSDSRAFGDTQSAGINTMHVSPSGVEIYTPQQLGDVKQIITSLKTGKTIMVNSSYMRSQDDVLRMMDLLDGATFALGGNMEQMDNFLILSIDGVKKV